MIGGADTERCLLASYAMLGPSKALVSLSRRLGRRSPLAWPSHSVTIDSRDKIVTKLRSER
jgi:hypothetical protein